MKKDCKAIKAQNLGYYSNYLPESVVSMDCEENNGFFLPLMQIDIIDAPLLSQETGTTKRCEHLDEVQNIYISNFLSREDEPTTIDSQREQTGFYIQDSENINKKEAYQQQLFEQKKQQISSQQIPKIRKRPSTRQHYSQSGQLCIDYTKNIPGYIFKRVIKLMFSPQYREKLNKACNKQGIDVEHFQKYYSELYPSIYGPRSLTLFFQITSPQQAVMKKTFENLICRILRGRYLLNSLKDGKMRDMSAYIQIKNKYLLYFSKLV